LSPTRARMELRLRQSSLAGWRSWTVNSVCSGISSVPSCRP
jgi:hypothetical protein